ncbi:hypothetical protein V2J09_018949 [Rumex salicifolius]
MEEQDQMCSNSSRFSKKQKQKKIPQRGLGVAQLEKIRMEEQQKKVVGNTIFTYPPLVSPTNSSSIPIPFLNYPSSQSPPSVPFTSPSPTSISSSQNPILRPNPAVSYDEVLYLNSVPVPSLNYPIGNGFEFGWKSVPGVDGSDHLHKMWHPYGLNHEKESSMWDQGLSICSNLSLPYESSPVLPLPDIMPRPPHFSQASASSLMNIPLMNSTMISNFQMEPPSNQNIYSNFTSLWQEEDKMTSAKRPYPFSLDMPALPTFHSKLPRIASTFDESIPFGNGSLFNAQHDIPIFKGTPLMPSSSSIEPTLKKSRKEKENQHGEFLTLAPPSISSPHPSPRLWHSLSHRNAEEPESNTPRSAAAVNYRFTENPGFSSGPKAAFLNYKIAENKAVDSGSVGLNYQHQFFSFIPPSKVQEESSATNKHSNLNGNGEVRGIIDLNLKL